MPRPHKPAPTIVTRENAEVVDDPVIDHTGTTNIDAWEPMVSPLAKQAISKLHADQSIADNRLTRKEKAALASQKTLLEFQAASERIGMTASEAAAKMYEAMCATNRAGEPNWWPRIMALKMWGEMHVRLSQTLETPEVMPQARLQALSPEQLRALSSEQIIEMMMVPKALPAPPDPPERGPYGRRVVRE